MSADKRRQVRTQSRFGSSCENQEKGRSDGGNQQTKVKRGVGNDRERKTSPGGGEILGHSRNETHKVTYQEHSHYTFSHLDPPKQPEEIKEPGMRVLSTTEFGESRIIYYPSFIGAISAFETFNDLQGNIAWQQMNIMIRGREYLQPRLVAWFGPFQYRYSGVVLEPQEMPDYVLRIKENIENHLAKENIEANFNSVLLNRYRSGSDSVAWHSDDELSMGIDPTIASVSLGEVRKFEIRRKPVGAGSDPPVEYFLKLKNGSLLIMDGAMQTDWQHRVPKEAGKAPRINLTFRTVHKIPRQTEYQ